VYDVKMNVKRKGITGTEDESTQIIGVRTIQVDYDQ